MVDLDVVSNVQLNQNIFCEEGIFFTYMVRSRALMHLYKNTDRLQLYKRIVKIPILAQEE